ncbi:hypothetical protein COHA_008533 [Chlorella ohadii]|uniref:Uncharacterized protein n=1 Tax=Chlorella ohadii TaxID=2649997 RepID=A0AAD5DHA2_9CHLO|nr:hypothetical protein COHA_008533 [Chlorella ohadii]
MRRSARGNQPGSASRGGRLDGRRRWQRLEQQLEPALGPPPAGDESGSSSGSHSGSSKRGGSTPEARFRGGPKPSSVPNVDAEQLLHSLGLDGAADPAALLHKLRKLPGVRQQGVLDNAAAVMAHLLSPAVGLMVQQAGQLLERCPYLFSWPPEQRAAVLFGQLMAAGLAAAAAAQCFVRYPTGAKSTTFAPGLAELAAILANSQDRQSGQGRRVAVPAAQRTVAALLTRSPSAVQLVCFAAGSLQQRAAVVQQAGFTPAQVADQAWFCPELLGRDASAKVSGAAAVLQQELGLPFHQACSLAARSNVTWLIASSETQQARAAALAEGFGQAAAAAMLLKTSAVLSCDPAVWQRNLCCMAACGVADPNAVLQRAPNLLSLDHAAADFLQRRLLLQHCFQLTATQLYEQHPSYLLAAEAPALAQRLQFVQHRGQAHRLVAKASRWASRATASPGQPAITVRTVGRPLREFLAAVGASQAEWEAWAAANPPTACPLYCWAQQAAEEEAARLAAALPPELSQWERRLHSRSRRRGAPSGS